MNMKPKEIVEKENNGYIELSVKQIDKYIVFNQENGTACFTYDYVRDNYTKATLEFGLKSSCDYDIKEVKGFLGLNSDKQYTRISDEYLYNDDLKIFFNLSRRVRIKISDEQKIIEVIKNELKNKK